jgi:DNA-binding GntR family transcriptional regulator
MNDRDKAESEMPSIAERTGAGPRKEEILADTVYRKLRKVIATDRFKPGQRLNVEKLARELGVSRTPVWEAIRGFLQEGILRNIPNRGVFMTERPIERVRDVLQVRASMDRLACSLAVGRIPRRTLNRLSACLREQLKAIEDADVAAYMSADSSFHLLICEVGGNQYLEKLYKSAITYAVPAMFDVLPFLYALYPVHQELFEALSAGNLEGVDKAITRHSDIILANLEQQMRADAERKEMIRRIKEDSPVSAPVRKRKNESS